MSRAHDVGGMHGFGKIDRAHDETDDPAEDVVAHRDWQLRLYALNRVLIGKGVYTAAEFRHARERLRPDVYLSTPYYDRLCLAVITLLEEKGIVSREELDVG